MLVTKNIDDRYLFLLGKQNRSPWETEELIRLGREVYYHLDEGAAMQQMRDDVRALRFYKRALEDEQAYSSVDLRVLGEDW
jgi:hypothetical protein